ncbi:uncharacterized protein CC84DRAFT_1160558 [Paraphaeosphaeria sporulosa]|uniref:Uncharacterized protein n=1 Tax=Paraphaeosphaeria sporulosa TaxID=1460663 RepID=A0A177CR23_9PLEO|nr:uncharacterized protein CC84DRAFT_1160558 [Paraphaeosphaeria sporulosa]OAG09392.1 hypothetical protein CC84DRAFT_1160558 [Paraphaeosphaeria sporulosa]
MSCESSKQQLGQQYFDTANDEDLSPPPSGLRSTAAKMMSRGNRVDRVRILVDTSVFPFRRPGR